MNLRRLGERGFIEELRRRFRGVTPPAPEGIGDDAALFHPRHGPLLLTTDCLIESRHFRRGEPPYLLGRKALAVNLSDVAAMGGRPAAFLLTLGIPDDLPARFLDDLVEGMASSAREHGVDLIGGDTSSSPGPLVISITLLGTARAGRGTRALTRTGAAPGDAICVSGPLGGSAAGRRLLESGWRARLDGRRRALVGAARPAGAPALLPVRALEALRSHLDPRPRLRLGRLLLEKRIASSAIDLSDGLSIDLSRLARASDVGARLLAPAIPIADCARAVGGALHVSPLDLALHGGEDYELLFTVPAAKQRLLARTGALTIGRITGATGGLRMAEPSGRERPLAIAGFDHFR
ncbi:MAG TPA: thiamine-phosphate kinase [Candidatus Polarisedimenticolia bacterium]